MGKTTRALQPLERLEQMSVSQIQILTATHCVNYRPSQQTDTLSPLLCDALWRAVFILNPGTPGARSIGR